MFSILNRRWTDFAIIGVSAGVFALAVVSVAHWKFGSFSGAVAAANNDWIWVKPDEFTLGSQPLGSKVPFTPSIVNHSGKQILLVGVELSCACIRTKVEGVHFPIGIDSGTELEVPLVMELANKRETRQIVHFVIGIDGEQRRLPVEVEASVRK